MKVFVIIVSVALLLILSGCGDSDVISTPTTSSIYVESTSIPQVEAVGKQIKFYTSVTIAIGSLSRHYAGDAEDLALQKAFNDNLNKVLRDYSEAGWVIYSQTYLLAEHRNSPDTRAMVLIFERDVNPLEGNR